VDRPRDRVDFSQVRVTQDISFMEAALSVTLLFVALIIGRTMAVAKTPALLRSTFYLGIYLLSILVQSVPYFGPARSTWLFTYESNLVMGAIPALLFHVTPAVIAYHAVRIVRKRKSSSSTNC